ncbi:MAG: SulP family inorganic anion transporter [bacterium]
MIINTKSTPKPFWQRVFPFIGWLPKVNSHTLRADLIAGLTVALVAIPQSLAYAQLAGVPAYYGLYASFLPVIIGALFGSSQVLSTGPVAMTSLLTAASVSAIAALGSDQYIAYVILMALLSGLFQIGLGIARLGVLVNFLSYPVLRGFINAAAIIIALAQLPAILGLKLEHGAHFIIDILHVIAHIYHTHSPSMIFGFGSLIALFLLKRYLPRLPGVLIVVAASTAISYLTGFEASGGTVVGVIPQGLPEFSLPPLDIQASVHMLPSAFVIALISFMEAMSSSKIIAVKTRTKWDENQELIGQGLAKVVAAFSHGMPVSGSFSRSALNLATGARTGLASVIAAVMVLLTLLFFTPLLHHLPKPVLAAIIMMAVFSLIDIQIMKEAWAANKRDGSAAIVTFIATLAFAPNIQDGILTGILLSLVLFLARTMKPEIFLLNIDKRGFWHTSENYHEPALYPGVAAIRYDGELYFANVDYFEKSIRHLICKDPDIRHILVVGDGINGLDASGVEMLHNLLDSLKELEVGISFCNLKGGVYGVMKRTGLVDRIGESHFHLSANQAITLIDQELNVDPEETEPQEEE